MCNIYYPYFKIEKNNKTKKISNYNHKHNIFLLALFCEKILIPARDLLEIEDDIFDVLLINKELFINDYVYTRIPDQFNNLEEYYDKIINKNNMGKSDYRIKKIITQLLSNNSNIYNKYSPLEQQGYYDSKIKSFFDEYIKSHHNIKGSNIIKEFLNDNSKMISKEDFDDYIKNLKNQREITKEIYVRLKKASDLLYFVAGASSGNIKVCYDKFYMHKCIETEIKKTITNFDEIINKKYDPREIIKFLIKMGIISNEKDVEKIDFNDLQYLRKQKCFDKFIKEYEKESISQNFDDYFSKKKNAYKIIITIKSIILSIITTILVSVILFFIAKTLLINIIASALSLVFTYLITYLWQKNEYEIPVFEKMLNMIVLRIDPVSLYLAKLKWKLSSK